MMMMMVLMGCQVATLRAFSPLTHWADDKKALGKVPEDHTLDTKMTSKSYL